VDVSSVAAQVQIQVQRLVLNQLRSQGADEQRLIASSAPPSPASPDPASSLGRILDVRV
jgi:hypothetical protein